MIQHWGSLTVGGCLGAEPGASTLSSPLVRAVQDAVRRFLSWPLFPQQSLIQLCLSVYLMVGTGLLGHKAAVCPIGFCCDWQMKQPLGNFFPSIFGLGTFLNIFRAAGAGAGEA